MATKMAEKSTQRGIRNVKDETWNTLALVAKIKGIPFHEFINEILDKTALKYADVVAKYNEATNKYANAINKISLDE